MRVGGSSSSHHAGMSSLWHDPDFEPIRQFQTPVVQKNYDDLPVPTEKHELPDGVSDPFAKLDAVYDAAAVQMERGIKGAEFLHGKKAPTTDPSTSPRKDDVARVQERPLDPARQASTTLDRQTRDHIRRLDQAANQPIATSSSSASKTAASKEAEQAANAGASGDPHSGLDAALTFGPMVAAQVAASTIQAPLPGLAAQAAQALQTVNTIAAAGEVALVGVAEATSESPDVAPPSGSPRRGLSRKS
jgi:hypothetical protein